MTENPKCPLGALYEYGSLLLSEKCPDAAINPLERAFEIDPTIFEVIHDLATAYASVGRKKEAIEKYEMAAKMSIASSELFYNIGRLHDTELGFQKGNSYCLKAL